MTKNEQNQSRVGRKLRERERKRPRGKRQPGQDYFHTQINLYITHTLALVAFLPLYFTAHLAFLPLVPRPTKHYINLSNRSGAKNGSLQDLINRVVHFSRSLMI